MSSAALFEKHKDLLEKALTAIRARDYWSPYPESPSKRIYGEDAPSDGLKAFEAMKGSAFVLDGHPGTGMRDGNERSPYGIDLGVSYPAATVDEVISAAKAGQSAWRDAGVDARTGACMVGAYKPLAEFVKLARKLKMDPTFVTISFVGSKALSAELGDKGEGVVISQVVPFPDDTSISLVADYHGLPVRVLSRWLL